MTGDSSPPIDSGPLSAGGINSVRLIDRHRAA